MKFLAVSDEIDHLVYSAGAPQRFADVDVVISCGDLPYSYLEFIADALCKRVYYVRGNHDKTEVSSQVERKAPLGGCDLHMRIVKVHGILIGGFEGSLRYRKGAYMYTQEEMWGNVIRMVPRLLMNRLRYGRYLDVLVTHAPPFGIHDREDLPHQGFKAFNWFLKVFRPTLHFHGHVHLYARNERWMTTFERTRIINAYSFRETVVETWLVDGS